MKNHISTIAMASMIAVMVAAGMSLRDRQRQEMRMSNDQSTQIILRGIAPATEVTCSVEVDPDGNILFANEEFRDTFGISEGDNIAKMLPHKSQTLHQMQIKEACRKHVSGKFRAYLEMSGTAVTVDGEKEVRVKAWTTHRGCAAFVDVKKPPGAEFDSNKVQ